MSFKKIYVRIARGKTNTTFHRAGMTFTKEWLAVGVDEATASCLYAEQMLEVTDVDPDAVEGLETGGSTSSPRTDADSPRTDDLLQTDDVTVRPELVEGQVVEEPVVEVAETQTEEVELAAKKKGKG